MWKSHLDNIQTGNSFGGGLSVYNISKSAKEISKKFEAIDARVAQLQYRKYA